MLILINVKWEQFFCKMGTCVFALYREVVGLSYGKKNMCYNIDFFIKGK
jgi:hypothetical protein